MLITKVIVQNNSLLVALFQFVGVVLVNNIFLEPAFPSPLVSLLSALGVDQMWSLLKHQELIG
jgi:hypothetical protein